MYCFAEGPTNYTFGRHRSAKASVLVLDRGDTIFNTVTPLVMAGKSTLKKFLLLATFYRELLPKKLSLHARYGGEESFLHGTGGIRRRDHFLVIDQRRQPGPSLQTTPQTNQSVQ